MATIGTFIEKEGKIIGKIQTLAINAGLTFLPNQGQSNPDAPAYRVFTGRTEVGAAWEKTSESSGRTYYSVRLDEPFIIARRYNYERFRRIVRQVHRVGKLPNEVRAAIDEASYPSDEDFAASARR